MTKTVSVGGWCRNSEENQWMNKKAFLKRRVIAENVFLDKCSECT